MKYDSLIVGAGLAGSVLAERLAKEQNKKVLLIDRRSHIGGNCYDEADENGILVHKYGPHIFHTNNENIWQYLSQFTEWHHYEHKVLAVIADMRVPVPFNLNSIELCFPENKAAELRKSLIDEYGYGAKIPILKLKQSEKAEFKELADYVYKYVFLGYTVKQWGMKPEDLDMSVTARIPVFISRDNRYFQDKFQGIPAKGYTEMFSNILNNKNIEIRLGTEFKALSGIEYDKLIYTGTIDGFFDYKYGKLAYRSLYFETEQHDMEFYQETAQINYPNDYDFTRITEFKHFLDYPPFPKTTIAREYALDYKEGENEPYYPVPSDENHLLYKQYYEEAEKLDGKVYFIGRLAEYKYYNMDQVVGRVLNFYEKNFK
jgi:UDP-galactopyranose mutase